jgi:nucleoside-diphosphate-sugar epimerase
VKVAVLGASGFVGGHIVRYLRQQGHDVRGIARHRRGIDPSIDWKCADACDVYAMRDALAGCDSVVHAALGTNQEIVDSVAPVYAAAEANNLSRVVYISSGSVHGQCPAPGTSEASTLTIRHGCSYNTANVRAERRLRQLRRRGTVETVVLRPTIVVGPGSRWVYDFADALHAGTAVVVDGARGICNSIYVDNLSHAVDLAMTRPGVDGEVFLVSDAETVRWRDLFRPIADAFGFDFDRVPSVSPPDPVYSFKQLNIDPIRSSRLTRNVIRSVSPDAKASLRSLVSALRATRRPAGAAQQPTSGPSAPAAMVTPVHATSITPEMIALQRCRWRLPIDKAVRLLGYTPPIPFAEGCHRSIEWLLYRSAHASAS